MRNHTIETEVSQKPRRRTRKVVIVATVLLLIGVGAAAAAVLFRAGMKGSTTVVTNPTFSYGTATTTMDDKSGIVCTPTGNGSTLSINITGAYPGSECEVSTSVIRTGGSNIKVQGVTVTGVPVDAWLTTGCGLDVPTSGSTNNVTIHLRVKANAPAGTTSMDETVAGINMVPSPSYVAANCPSSAPAA